MNELRPYQLDLVERVRAEYRAGARSVLMQSSTGSGKTHTASAIIDAAVARGRRVVFAAHLDAISDDTSERLADAGIDHGSCRRTGPRTPQRPSRSRAWPLCIAEGSVRTRTSSSLMRRTGRGPRACVAWA